MIKVGFGRVCITPDFPVCLVGGGAPQRIHKGVLEDIYVTCVALTDESGTTALLYSQDVVSSMPYMCDLGREAVTKATGVCPEMIQFTATHTHSSAPVYANNEGHERFRDELYIPGLVKAATLAMEDRADATAQAGQFAAKGMTFVRRYKLADGTYEGARGNTSQCKEFADHAYPADETVQVIRFCRQGKKDVLLSNLGAHATFKGATTQMYMSPDFPGAIRDCIEARGTCLVAHFISAAGDQTPNSRMESDDHGLNYRQYGDRIGQMICERLPELKPISTGKLKVIFGDRDLPTNKLDLHRLEDAQYGWELFKKVGFQEATPVVHAMGFASVYECRSIVSHAELPDTKNVRVNALRCGDIAITFSSYEMYSENGAFVRENSPFPMTFITSCANGANGYLPSRRGYEIGCYEAYSANVGCGSGEIMAELFIDLLNQLKF